MKIKLNDAKRKEVTLGDGINLISAIVRSEAVSGEFVDDAISQPRLTDADLKISENVDLEQIVSICVEIDGEALGEIFETNWSPTAKATNLLIRIAKEMKRKFKLIAGKKDVLGKPLTLRGCTSFKEWFPKATGKSFQYGYYLLKGQSSSASRKPNSSPSSSDQAADTLVRTYYVIRRKSDGIFWGGYSFWSHEIHRASVHEELDEYSKAIMEDAVKKDMRALNKLLKFDKKSPKFDPTNYEWVGVEAIFKLTPVSSTEPKPNAKSKKVEQAEEWLKKYLADGPQPIPASFIQHGVCRYNYPKDSLPPHGVGGKSIDIALVNLGVIVDHSGPKGGKRWTLPQSELIPVEK